MSEVKHRIHVVYDILSKYKGGRSTTGFRESDIEVCFLQIRKCLELVMYSCLSAQYHAGVSLQEKIYNKEWNAVKILKYIEGRNPGGFPQAVKSKWDDLLNRGQISPRDDALTKDDFIYLYDRICGKYMHANRNIYALRDHESIFENIEDWTTKIVNLLDDHWIPADMNFSFAVRLYIENDKPVLVATMQRIR